MKRPSTHNAWTKYKQGLGNETLTHLITMTETACKDSDPAWTGPLPGRITAATNLLHRLVTDTAIASLALAVEPAGSQVVGTSAPRRRLYSQYSTPVQSGTGPASKRQSGGASGSGGGSKPTDAQIEQLRRTHVAFTDPDEPKPFSKQLMDYCRARGLCLFCMKGKHRMFNCRELQRDSARLTRLKNAYLARCIPIEHGSEQSADQMQVLEQPCNALVMNAGRSKEKPRLEDQPADELSQEDARCGDTSEHSHADSPSTMTCSPEIESETGNVPCADDPDEWTQGEQHGKIGDLSEKAEDECMHSAVNPDPCASIDDTHGPYESADRVHASDQSILLTEYKDIESVTITCTRDLFAAA